MVASESRQAKQCSQWQSNLKQEQQETKSKTEKYRGPIFQLVSVKSVSLKVIHHKSTSPSSSSLHAIPHVNYSYTTPESSEYKIQFNFISRLSPILWLIYPLERSNEISATKQQGLVYKNPPSCHHNGPSQIPVKPYLDDPSISMTQCKSRLMPKFLLTFSSLLSVKQI